MIPPTLEILQALRPAGVHKGLTEQMVMPDIDTLDFEERLDLSADSEIAEREDRPLSIHTQTGGAGIHSKQ